MWSDLLVMVFSLLVHIAGSVVGWGGGGGGAGGRWFLGRWRLILLV